MALVSIRIFLVQFTIYQFQIVNKNLYSDLAKPRVVEIVLGLFILSDSILIGY